MTGRRDTLLLISTSYPIATDGSEAAGAFVADVAAELAARMPVRIVAPGLRAGREDSRGNGIEVRRFASTGKPLSLLSPFKPWHWPEIAKTLCSLRRETFLSAADGRVAHTLALWALPSGWAARALKQRQGVPYSVWALGSDIWTIGRIPLLRGLLKQVCAEADHAFADGLKLADESSAITGRPFAFLPSARKLEVRRERPVAIEPPYAFLFLGRWHPNKGIDLLLDALALLRDEDWARIREVHIAGGGPLEGLVQMRVAGLKQLGRPLRLSGFLDGRLACEALAAADRLLLPSRVESIPVVFSDAVKFGLPVVAMPVGDLPVLVARGAGVVAREVSAFAFAAALREEISRQHTDDDRAKLEEISITFDPSKIASQIASNVRRDGDG